MKIIAAFSVAGALTALASPCFAQRAAVDPGSAARPAQPPQSTSTPDAESAYTVTRVNGQRVYVLVNHEVLYGERQRPYAFAVTGRSALGYTALETARSFVPEVNAAVRRDPF